MTATPGDKLNWYPGLMDRTKRFLDRHAKKLDLFLEVTDARAPASARWRGLPWLLGDAPRLLVLNKADLASPTVTAAWLDHYRHVPGDPPVFALAAAPVGAAAAQQQAAQLRRAMLNCVAAATGDRHRVSGSPVKVAAVGIPNVGKSSLLNLLAGRRRAPTGARPGLTRGEHWLVISKDLWLLDMPGVLPPVAGDGEQVARLALIGAVPEGAYGSAAVAASLIRMLLASEGPAGVAERLRVANVPDASGELDVWEWLDTFGRRRGLLAAGGAPDRERAAAVLIAEFRRGALGRISLEVPGGAIPSEPGS